MSRTTWLSVFILTLAVGLLSAKPREELPDIYNAKKANMEAVKLITGNEDIRMNIVGDPVDPFDYGYPRRDPLGEVLTVGYTWYDYQHNGTIGKMIAVDSDGGIHITWMKGFDAQNANRKQCYNAVFDGELLSDPDEGVIVDNSPEPPEGRAGYGCLTLLPEDDRAMVFYHVMGVEGAEGFITAMSYDFLPGIGAFEATYPPGWPNIETVWPKGAISGGNIAHILSSENAGENPDQIWQRIAYWRGEPLNEDFDEWDWSEPAENIDTTGAITATGAGSILSDKVVLAWHHNRIGADLGDWDGARGAWQRNNDIRYIVSEDGDEFDWENDVKSLTKIIGPDAEMFELDPDEAYGDTFRPYTDVDIQFDPWDDKLYGVFATNLMWERPYVDDAGNIIDGMTGEHNYMWFWAEEGGEDGSDTITFVADGYYFNRTDNGGWRSRCGGWRMNVDRGSIAFDPNNEGHIYVVFCQFPKIMFVEGEGQDAHFVYIEPDARDTSGLGYSNAEIMVSVSTDYGITWSEAVNVTDTRWEEENPPRPGECMSENWPSVAYVADEALHITYILDLEAGGWPQNEGGTQNDPVIYHRVPLEDLNIEDLDPVELPREGLMFHNYFEERPVIADGRRAQGAPLPDQDVDVTATVMGGQVNAITGAELLYYLGRNVDEEFSVEMEDLGDDVYGAAIPGQENGTVVWYKVKGINDAGLEAVFPRDYYWAYTVRGEGQLTIRDVQEFPIGDWGVDYSPYRGYEVTVTGVVTTTPVFSAIYEAYAIQDDRQEWSGIFVRGIDDALNVGDEITVTGTVMERDPDEADKWQYATYIQMSEYEVISQENDVPPMVFENAGDIRYSGFGETLEGCLVQLRTFTVDTLEQEDIDEGYWAIYDESGEGWLTVIGLSPQEFEDSDMASWVLGTEVEDFTGIMTENYGHYAIAPRISDDVGPFGVSEDGSGLSPYDFALDAPYPNPFNSTTSISFSLQHKGWAHLGVFDLQGRLVSTLVESEMRAGQHRFMVDASLLATGVYMLRLETETQTASQKLVLVK